jgi:predicted ATP-dependent endonuclease of OLD family
MKILKLESENVKRLKAISIEPNGNVVVLNGMNEQGKTSVLDSIEMALRGKKFLATKPLREGQKKGHTKIDLGDLIVTRTYTEGGGGTLRVENKDGLSYSSPQSVLDKLLATVSFDPLEFTRMKPTEQMKVIQDLAGVDFDELNGKRKLLYENRTENNRELKRIEGVVQSYQDPSSIPSEMPTTASIIKELDEAKNHNAQRGILVEQFNDASRIHPELEAEVRRLKEALDMAIQKVKTNSELGRDIKIKIEKLDPVIGLLPIQEKLDNIEAEQEAFRNHKVYLENLDEEKRLAKISNGFTDKIEAIDTQKKEALENANLPVDGLELREDGVYLNNLPFDQASGAVKIKTSVALGIKMNPELKVLIIRDGSLLDDKSMEVIQKMADENDAQIWVERVGDKDKNAILIVDGEVSN